MVALELDDAQRRCPAFNSAHEGKACIDEEYDELWREIKNDKRDPKVRATRMREEACQLAAMAVRLMVDCT